MTLPRRALLAGLAGTVAAGCLPEGRGGPFPLGVGAGDAAPDGAVLWTRFDALAPLRLRVWPEGRAERDAQERPAPVVEGFSLVTVTGLAPGTWHRYRFVSEAGDESPPGRFRTALAPGALEPLVFGAASCIKRSHSYATLGRAAERTDLDAFIFLGDAVYTDGSVSVADFRGEWERGLRGADYLALRGATSMVALWDDHEVRNNWEADTVSPGLLANARRAFLEHQPLRQDPAAPTRLWRRLKWGRTAELFVLDGRSERSRARGEYLSPEQLSWLTTSVRASDAVFKLVLNTVPIGSFDTAFFAPFNDDNWQAYPAQRAQLLEGLEAEGVDGVIVVSGDFHLGCFGRAARSGPGARTYEALVGPGANDPNPLPTYPRGDPWEFSTAVNNYVSFALDPASRRATVRYHAGDGRVLFERVLG